MPVLRKYPGELREWAVLLVQEPGRPDRRGLSVGVYKVDLQGWARRAETYRSEWSADSAETEELTALRRE